MKLKDLTGIRIADWLAKEAETRPTRAALAFRLLSGFINWCDSQVEYAGLVPSGACKVRQVRDVMPSNNTRLGDSLQKEQLPAWFAAVKQIQNPVISAYLQTVLLTGRRRRQVAELKWTDIDFQWNKITMNDKVEHTPSIPLTPYVADLLQALPRRNQYVFSSPTAKAGYLAEPTDAHHKACVEAGVDLSLHGLRRSFANLSEWVDVPDGIASQIQGHAPQGVRAKNYIRRPLDLLRMWHVKIEAWILDEAGIKFEPVKTGLRVATAARVIYADNH